MLWGKPDGYSFSPGVDEAPFNDGCETADTEAIEVLDELSDQTQYVMMTYWYAYYFLRDIPTV